MSSIIRLTVALLFALACGHAQGSRFAYVGIDDDLEVIDVDTRQTVRSIALPSSAGAVAVSPDGGRVYVHLGTSIAVVDPDLAAIVDTYPEIGGNVRFSPLVLTRDGSRLYVGGTTSLHVFDTATGSELASVGGLFQGTVRALAVDALDSRLYASFVASGQGTVAALGPALTLIASRNVDPGARGMVLAPDSSALYLAPHNTSLSGNDLTVLDPATLDVLATLPINIFDELVLDPVLAISLDGRRLVMSSSPLFDNGYIVLIGTDPLRVITVRAEVGAQRSALAIHPDRDEVWALSLAAVSSASGAGRPRAQIFELETLNLLHEFHYPGDPVTQTRGDFFSPGPRIVALVADPANPGAVYAAARMRGVHRSADAGETWLPNGDGLPPLTTARELRVAPNGSVYALLTRGWLYRSDDQGASWSRIGESLGAIAISAFSFGVDAQTLFVASDGAGVWRSDDGGQTFAPYNQGLTP